MARSSPPAACDPAAQRARSLFVCNLCSPQNEKLGVRIWAMQQDMRNLCTRLGVREKVTPHAASNRNLTVNKGPLVPRTGPLLAAK
jgi:hypothetical protein